MTPKQQAAMRQALEALDSDNPEIQLRAALGLRAALAEPVQEPVAREQVLVKHIEFQKAETQKYFELYNRACKTAQLRLKEIARLESRLAALDEPAQEPVAWWKQHRDGSVELNEARTFIAADALATGRRPLVFGDTAPPAQCTWVGLTDEEIDEWTPEIHTVIRAIEAKLKEKNT